MNTDQKIIKNKVGQGSLRFGQCLALGSRVVLQRYLRISRPLDRRILSWSPFRPHRESPGPPLHPINHRSNKAHRPPIAQYFTRERRA